MFALKMVANSVVRKSNISASLDFVNDKIKQNTTRRVS
jgi:hypothetical protein